eukprot:6189939-Pleurochrysis_carterae.AAC.1
MAPCAKTKDNELIEAQKAYCMMPLKLLIHDGQITLHTVVALRMQTTVIGKYAGQAELIRSVLSL